MSAKLVSSKTFEFGAALVLEVKSFDNGDGDGTLFQNQTIEMNANCNSASFNLCGDILTPEMLRQLANELEAYNIQTDNLSKA